MLSCPYRSDSRFYWKQALLCVCVFVATENFSHERDTGRPFIEELTRSRQRVSLLLYFTGARRNLVLFLVSLVEKWSVFYAGR